MLSAWRVAYSFPNKGCLKRGVVGHKDSGGLSFSRVGSSLARFQTRHPPESALKSTGQLITSQELGERPGPGAFVPESQSATAPSHESHFQLERIAHSCLLSGVSDGWELACLWAATGAAGGSRGEWGIPTPARARPQSRSTRTLWGSTEPCLHLRFFIKKNQGSICLPFEILKAFVT